MKKSGLKIGVLVAMLTAMGCADAAIENADMPHAGDSCSSNMCKDADTVLSCINGMYVEIGCPYGCEENACKMSSSEDDSCVVDTCLDAMTLSKCVNKVAQIEPCAFGCESGACKPSNASTTCLASVCQDNVTLLACVEGVQKVVDCPYGCDKGICLQACTADTCLNAGTLLKCTDGRTQSIHCQYGCEMGVCLTACNEDFCRDSNTLMACVDGHSKAVSCPYGCNAGKCNQESSPNLECSEDTCGNEMTLYKCVNGNIQAQFCQYGCAEGACNASQCTQDVCADGTTLNVCVNGVVKSIDCPHGCDNGKCQKKDDSVAPECTTSVCVNASLLNKCVNGKFVTENCPNGCENGACKDTSTSDQPGSTCVYGNYVEKCIGEVVYYCSEGVVETLDCSQYAAQGYACKAFDMSDGTTFANCMSSAESCTTVNSKNNYCEPYSNYGNVEAEETCTRSKTDQKNYWVTTSIAQCATATAAYGGSCNAEGTACADPSSSGDTGEYTNCSADTCTMSDGSSMLCGDACEEFYGAGNEAWCTADGSVTCAPSDPSGGSSDYVDCTNDVCGANGETCLEICVDNDYDTDKAWCDDQYVYCEDPTGGSSSGGGSSDGPSVDKNSCNISNVAGIEPFGECNASQSECEVHVCWEDIQYGGYYTEYLVCMDLSSYGSDYGYMWYPIDGIYMACNNNCAADSQSCDSQGGEYGQYTSN